MSFDVIAIRLSKVVVTGGVALWALLVALGNVVDHEPNWVFLQQVLSMDGVFENSTLTWRAVTHPTAHWAAFVAIIAVEALTGLAFLAAACVMAVKLTSSTAAFRKARAWTALGVILGFGLFCVGFMSIGSEWFLMWQSETWSARESAYRFYMTILAVAIYVFLDTDGD